MISSIHLPLCQLHIVDQLEAIYLVPLFFNRPLRNCWGNPDAAPAAGQNSPGQKKCTGTLSMCVI